MCQIQVVDEDTGWPVPLVELTTTHHVRFVSDNAGNIAFDLPELMDVETWFTIEGHGYSVTPDGFGNVGVRLTPKPGAKLRVPVERRLPAKRLGRITGGGLLAESQKLGKFLAWKEQGLLGCDSVQTAVHNGRLYWGWGDTTLPHYPLGLFHMTGATTDIHPLESFRPPIQLRYDYFRDENGLRCVAQLPGSGPTWLSGYASLPDATGQQRLVATYSKITAPLEAYDQGLCVWNETTQNFERHRVIWQKDQGRDKPPTLPAGHAVYWRDEQGKRWILFGDPFPTLRCEATFEAWSDPESWELLEPQTSVATQNGREITPHRGAIAWNAYRQKWVCIFCQLGGDSSFLGELWYVESTSPMGPWTNAIQVVTHARYSFYNPCLHPEWVREDSPILLFEATFTKTFSKTPTPTPRHDYNQILYRLDLDELAGQLDNAGR